MKPPRLLAPTIPSLYIGREVVAWHRPSPLPLSLWPSSRRDSPVQGASSHWTGSRLSDSEAHSGDVGAALARLAERIPSSHAYVRSHLPPESMLLLAVSVPDLNDDELEPWVRDQVREHYPEGFAESDLVVRWEVTGQLGRAEDDAYETETYSSGSVYDAAGESSFGGGSSTLVMAFAERRVVDETLALLEAAGYEVASLLAPTPLLAHALSKDEEYARVLAEEAHGVWWERGFEVHYDGGALQSVRYAPESTSESSWVVREPSASDVAKKEAGTALDSEEVGAPLFAMARALSLAGSSEGVPVLDFLSETEQDEAVLALDRLGLARMVRLVAVVLVMLFGMLGAYGVWGSYAQEQARADLAERVPDLQALEAEEAELEALLQDRQALRRFEGSRSRSAAWLHAASGALPSGVRLTAFSLQSDTLGMVSGTLRGESDSEASVGQYAERLKTMRLGGEVVYLIRKRGASEDVVEFEIKLYGSILVGP